MESPAQVQIRVEMFKENSGDILSGHGSLDGKFGPKTWRLETEYSNISDIAEEEQVKWISPQSPEPITLNDKSREVIGVEKLQFAPYELNGSGFTAAIWDGGLAGNHSDLNYTLTWAEGNKTVRGDPSAKVADHATHVAGTMLGGGKKDSQYRGMAPESRLLTYKWPVDSKELYGEINDSINNYDSILSQNSWGYNTSYGEYNYIYGNEYDSIVSNRTTTVSRPFNVIFAAGNARGPLERDYNTTIPPATAKNVVTVGAVDDAKKMTYYSSWGPTDDGRIKPTVVADGGNYNTTGLIKSTIPSNTVDYSYPYDGMQGTSMAAPAVSGAAILLNQQFNRSYGYKPSPATVKGAFIHTAEDLNRTGPDYVTGWGLVNATAAIDYVSESKKEGLIWRGTVRDTSDNVSYDVSVPEGESLNFTLVWSDYPGTSGSGRALINDLDLVVRNSSGHRYYPWTLNWSIRKQQAVRTKEDHRNVVEQVYVPETFSGELTVSVNGSSVPEAPQSYSLFMPVSASVVPSLTVETVSNTTYGEVPDFNVSSDRDIIDAKFSIDGSGNYSLKEKNSTFFYNRSVELANGTHQVVFWANNSNGWGSESVYFLVDEERPVINAESPVESANVSGNFSVNATWSDGFTQVVNHSFTVSNRSFSANHSLNATLNSTGLEDGEYNVTYNVSDKVGNYNFTRRSITVDNSRPSLESFDPGDESFSGNFSVNATWTDSVTGVKQANYSFGNETFSRNGSLNATVDTSNLSEGVYNLSYILQDYAGNYLNRTFQVSIDRASPSFDIFKPLNGSYVGPGFEINVSVTDPFSDIVSANYTLSNGTVLRQGELNSTVDTSNLSDALYNLSFTAEDEFGNVNSTRINVTLDTDNPLLNFTEPSDGQIFQSNFSVNATFSDDEAVEAANYTLYNASFSETGGLNATFNSSNYRDGRYNITVNVSDKAGNLNSSTVQVVFDDTPPELTGSSVVEDGNISGNYWFNASFKDFTGVDTSRFRVFNSTGNVTDWRQFNSTVDSSNLSEGVYNVTFSLNDTQGNFREFNRTVNVDNTVPEMNLTVYNLSVEFNDWVNNSKTVGVNCSDAGVSQTGVETVETPGNVSSLPDNVSLGSNGEKTYSFRCVDFAGNRVVDSKTFRIDSLPPGTGDADPSNSTEGVSTAPSINLELDNEFDGSGVNASESSVEVSSGSIEDVDWSNSSVNVDLSGVGHSTNFTLDYNLVDNMGHSRNTSLNYVTEEEEQNTGQKEEGATNDDPGGGGGGGGVDDNATASTTEDEGKNVNSSEVKNLVLKAEGSEASTAIGEIDKGQKVVVKVQGGVSVEDVGFSSGGPAEGVEVTVRGEPAEVPRYSGEAYTYQEIVVENISDFGIKDASINFTVNKSYLEENNAEPDQVVLRRYRDGWKKLPTALKSSGGDSYLYSAKTPGFSYYAVTLEEEISKVDSNAEESNVSEEVAEKTENEDRNGFPWTPVAVFVALVVIAAVLFSRRESIENFNLRDLGIDFSGDEDSSDQLLDYRIRKIKKEIHDKTKRGELENREEIMKAVSEAQSSLKDGDVEEAKKNISWIENRL
ncbi:MAG: S8 family serine peptidase [Candidatus Nanohalobium sp.]